MCIRDRGIFINPVIPPACAPQDTLVRVALMATHTTEQVDYARCVYETGPHVLLERSVSAVRLYVFRQLHLPDIFLSLIHISCTH